MRKLLKAILFLAGTAALLLLAGFCWLYFYSRDLPDVGALAQFAPDAPMQASEACIGNTIAIPYDKIGLNLRNAISAAETSERDPSVLKMVFQGIVSQPTIDADPRRSKTVIASWYVSRTMCYPPSKNLKRQLLEIRTAIQLERHFSRRDLFTMYVNRVYFAEDEIGAQNASQRLFGKNPADLDISQAALLAGMIRSPSRFSPYKHPDRAMLRRNEVIDAMIAANMISSADGESAKSNALRGSPVQPPTQGQNPP